MAIPNPKQLVAEDTDLQGAIIGLMKHYIPSWGMLEHQWPVKITVGKSASQILNDQFLSTMLQASGLTCLGLVFDADDKFGPRWEYIKKFCEARGVKLNGDCPATGLVVPALAVPDLGPIRFGVWIMPDNKSSGMLENFCHDLVPDKTKPLWQYAKTCAEEAQKHGATYIAAHADKAHIHAWLAFQDPPGERIGSAITKRLLDHKAATAKVFAGWFRDLYEIDPDKWQDEQEA